VHDIPMDSNESEIGKDVSDINDHPANHSRIYFCEECEETLSDAFCEDWEQYMWADCNQKIHNKAKRAKHVRNTKNIKESYQKLRNNVVYSEPAEFNENKQINIVENTINSNDSSAKNASMTTESTSFKRSISDGWRLGKNLPPTGSKYATLLNLKNAKSFIPIEKRKLPSSYYPQFSGYPLNKNLNSITPMYKNRNLRPNSSSSMGSTNSSVDYTPYYDGSSTMSIPIYQPYVKIDMNVPQKLHNQVLLIQQVMRAKATEGNLMIESSSASYITLRDSSVTWSKLSTDWRWKSYLLKVLSGD
jgi:uncharacterized protein YlaI